ARILRTVADETVTPEALTRSEEGTGSPSAMYSRTRAARIRLDRSEGSISTRELRLLSNYTLQPAKRGGSGNHQVREPGVDCSQTRTQDEVSYRLTGFRDHLIGVHADRRAVFDKDLAVDNGRRHVRPASRIHQR